MLRADTDELTSGRRPVYKGKLMDKLKIFVASQPETPPDEIEFSHGAGSNFVFRKKDSINQSYSGTAFRTSAIDKVDGDVNVVIDSSFRINKFAGCPVAWSELVKAVYQLPQFIDLIDAQLEGADALVKYLVPLDPNNGIFVQFGIRRMDGYDIFNVGVATDTNAPFIVSYKSGAWTWREVLNCYMDWFAGNKNDTTKFYTYYESESKEAMYYNTTSKLPKFVQEWYKAYFAESLTLWEMKPNNNDLPQV